MEWNFGLKKLRGLYPMKLNSIANIIDTEHDNGTLLEIGLTQVNVKTRSLGKSYSIPIQPYGFDISPIAPRITELTGWTNVKLWKQGVARAEAIRLLEEKHGIGGRLLVSDSSDEARFIERLMFGRLGIPFLVSPHRLNVSILFSLLTGEPSNVGLEKMLDYFDWEIEGRLHSAKDDSRNIARLFIEILNCGKFTCSED
jgi:hypothetical protein